ncbi:hypothetical protein [Streptomyces sp. NPDC050560]|uniref:hypothetical protein n=1 Tax=Streptomyces sp. NPDC050560 TaxID=3365630 RepID=UPI00379B9C9B
MTNLWPAHLTWADVDPERHPCTLDDDAAAALVAEITPLVPGPGARKADRDRRDRAVVRVTELFAGRYGRWACGWNYSQGEGDHDGGVVTAWCCAAHSITTPEATAPRMVAGLREWRAWLDELAERFTALAPRGTPPDPWYWERACTRLVTVVADRTAAESGWYGHCMQVLGWFLARHGIDEERAVRIVRDSVGGRFESWVAPDAAAVDTASTSFARAVATED